MWEVSGALFVPCGSRSRAFMGKNNQGELEMKRFGRFLCLIIAAAMTASLICSGASAAFVRPGATDGAGGVANAVEDFLHGRLNDPSAGQVASDILNVVSSIDLEHMESVVADKLVNYDYATASQLLGNGVIAVTGKEAQRISDLANGRMPHDTQAMSETRYFWVFMNDKSFYTSDSDNLVLQTAQGALVHMIGVTMAGKFVELYARTDALGMATFDNVPYGQYFCGASYTDPKTGYNYETETMSEHVWVPASGKLQNLTMTRVDALSNSYLDQIKRELISGGYDVNDKYSPPAAQPLRRQNRLQRRLRRDIRRKYAPRLRELLRLLPSRPSGLRHRARRVVLRAQRHPDQGRGRADAVRPHIRRGQIHLRDNVQQLLRRSRREMVHRRGEHTFKRRGHHRLSGRHLQAR
jgi:hypothetical protein